ncbi:glutathione S-transferase [Fluviicoccus keumensis]|uniref:Glutathione S-transferase n=1 Tax=Fluviicoccus keumensis TaxID=1435465 RepID=A0A4Q7Z8E2_9GAMM|nr:glutathione S-transferase family protein [Fluviicoccus keumensis]RZU46792.1 glutathione S-transferase [Fluviicoccus keumensis]
MADLILHHYPMSPFSEKIRAMLGYTGLSWQSVITREMPPRPLLARLAGGYRKIPVAQIGADIFCDSRTITAEIASLSGKPELALENGTPEMQAYVAEVDLTVFFACLFAAGTPTLNRKVWESMSLVDIGRFLWDRINMGRKARVRAISPLQAKPRVKQHLADVEQKLSGDFLFGTVPTHADFSTYHSLWFIHELAESPLLRGYPRTLAWMERMKAFGHGDRWEITAEAALEIAGKAAPRPIPAEHRQDPLIGSRMRIAPNDYGQIPTDGILAGATATTWILARHDAELGNLHLHFPKQGFQLTTQ